ncbi:uncharacterized protein LOC132718558 [Ruditapes philippinarum]|uniref:uncharacterized protein LOC132718558 n=1 Tax=Ruditapes philippinarum TaxID=129788 RepID=UPI00295C2DA4|nr:uncharacterized protein LOC132718558 [Ruditapes philippinarum]
MADKNFIAFILCCCVTVVASGSYCTKYHSGSIFDDTIYCPSLCCGDKYNRYCCNSNTGLIVGIVFGVLGLIAIVVTVLVAVFCCCRKSRGQQGQVCQPAGVVTTTPYYGVQTTTVTGYGQTGYTNAGFPQQMQATNVAGQVNDGQKWQQPPPPYSAVNTS